MPLPPGALVNSDTVAVESTEAPAPDLGTAISSYTPAQDAEAVTAKPEEPVASVAVEPAAMPVEESPAVEAAAPAALESVEVDVAAPVESAPAAAEVPAVAVEAVAAVETAPAVEAEPAAVVEAAPAVEAEPVAAVEAAPAVEAEPVAAVEAAPAVEAEPAETMEAAPAAEVPAVTVEPSAAVEAAPVAVEAEPVAAVEAPTPSAVEVLSAAVVELPAPVTEPLAATAEPEAQPVAEVPVSSEPTGPVPAVSAEQVLAAIESAATQGALGKALLAYSEGRFKRAFLLGESFGLARVGRAWGPGSDSSAALALQVDLDAPSILTAATVGHRPVIASTPAEPQDAAIFAALAEEPTSQLVVAPLQVRGRAVAFFVADQGATPVAEALIDEMARVIEKASEAYGRLHLGRQG
jgi:hypothetical protein